MASFYTGDGDQGETGFLGKGRISKSSLRIEAVGTVDEVTAALGLSRSIAASEKPALSCFRSETLMDDE